MKPVDDLVVEQVTFLGLTPQEIAVGVIVWQLLCLCVSVWALIAIRRGG